MNTATFALAAFALGALVALESFPEAGALVNLALVGALVDAVGTDVGLTVGSSAR